jgi:hypothetical protein
MAAAVPRRGIENGIHAGKDPKMTIDVEGVTLSELLRLAEGDEDIVWHAIYDAHALSRVKGLGRVPGYMVRERIAYINKIVDEHCEGRPRLYVRAVRDEAKSREDDRRRRKLDWDTCVLERINAALGRPPAPPAAPPPADRQGRIDAVKQIRNSIPKGP